MIAPFVKLRAQHGSANQTMLLAWQWLRMQASTSDTGEDAAIKVLQGRWQGDWLTGEERGTPFGQVTVRGLGLPDFEELLSFRSLAGLLEGQCADEVANRLTLVARWNHEDLVTCLAGGVRSFQRDLALSGEPIFQALVKVRRVRFAGAKLLRPLAGGFDQTQHVVERAGLQAFDR